jgi:diguanylate cyclase (GGDEF)-like protein
MSTHIGQNLLKRRYIRRTLSLLVIPLLAFSIGGAGLNIYRDYQTVHRNAQLAIRSLSIFMEAQATQLLEEAAASVTGIKAEYPEKADAGGDAALAMLRRAMRFDSSSSYLYIIQGQNRWIVDRAGRQVVDPAVSAALAAYVPVEQGPLGHAVFVKNAPFLPMVVSGLDHQGRSFSAGALVDLGILQNIYNTVGTRDGLLISLIGMDGAFLARHPDFEHNVGRILHDPPSLSIYRKTHQAGLSQGISQTTGEPTLFYFTPSTKFDFIASVALTEESIIAPWRARTLAALVLIAFVILIAGTGTLILCRLIRNLAESEAFHQGLMREANDAILLVDAEGRVITGNRCAVEMFGARTESELIGRQLRTMAPVLQPNQRLSTEYGEEIARQVREEAKESFEWTYQKLHSSETFTCTVHLSKLDWRGQGIVLAIIRDITDQKRYLAKQEYLAAHDALTGLPNRYAFGQRVETHIAEAPERRIAILLMDLNRFKEVNDTLGHQRGDEVLQQVGSRLQHWLRKSGAEIARLGGDELVVMLPDALDRAQVINLCEGMQARLQRPIQIGDVQLELTAAIGISFYPDDGQDPTALLRCADIAMYKAKRTQSSFEFYHLAGDHFTTERLTLQTELAKAVRDETLHLNFQPKLRLTDRKVVGAEALLRWTHAERGVISPGAFIPLVETTELIHSLTRWVLDAALKQLRLWLDDGMYLSIAVNISTTNLRDAGFIDAIAKALDRHGIPPELLEIEITESALIDDPELALERLEGIRALGVSLSIDDFGTGYSSLAYLKRLPVQGLKIDKSFVDSVATNNSDTMIVDATLMLARNFGLKSVAEGVENNATLETLEGLGCDIVQGYVFGRPMPADMFRLWYLQHNLLLEAVQGT